MKSAFDVVDAFTVVGPWRDRQSDSPFELEDLIAEHERYGIRHRLAIHAEARGMPILAHTWGDESVRALARSARAYPGIPFLAGHSGAGDVEVNLEEARRTPNLFLELTYSAGTPWLVERLVREIGAERVVWARTRSSSRRRTRSARSSSPTSARPTRRSCSVATRGGSSASGRLRET